MERPIAGPRRPARVLESTLGLREMLFSHGWFVIGAVGLVTVMGLGAMAPLQGVDVVDWGGHRSGWELTDPRDLFWQYGIAFALAWPAALLFGCARSVIRHGTSARHEAAMEARRSRVHLTLLGASSLAIVVGWAGALVCVIRLWPGPAHAVGNFVGCCLLLFLVLAVVRKSVEAVISRLRRRPERGDVAREEGLA